MDSKHNEDSAWDQMQRFFFNIEKQATTKKLSKNTVQNKRIGSLHQFNQICEPLHDKISLKDIIDIGIFPTKKYRKIEWQTVLRF